MRPAVPPKVLQWMQRSSKRHMLNRRSSGPELTFKLYTSEFVISDYWKFNEISLEVTLGYPATVMLKSGLQMSFTDGSSPVTFVVAAQGSLSATPAYSVAGGMAGTWTNLFGLKGLDVSDASVALSVGVRGVTVGGSINVMIGYTSIDFALYIPFKLPWASVFHVKIENFNLAGSCGYM